jgi:hypothetical protein
MHNTLSYLILGLILIVTLGGCTEQPAPVVPGADEDTAITGPGEPDLQQPEGDLQAQDTQPIPQDTGEEDANVVSDNGAAVDIANQSDTAPELDTTPEPDTMLAPDTAPEPDTTPPPQTLTIKFTQPGNAEVSEEGSALKLITLVSSNGDKGGLTVSFSSDLDGELGEAITDNAGWATLEFAPAQTGWHTVKAIVTNAENTEASAEISVGICSYGQPNTFDAGTVSADWKIYGDAYFDPGGWLEMTGNASGKHGAIYNAGSKINPGDIEISLKIWTGGGINTGADGYAMTIINAKDVAELESVISSGKAGGCLGYGVGGTCGDMQVDAFHVEFDTWENNNHKDPTPKNHIAITLDGDPSSHILWAEQVLEDSTWHDVNITIFGTNIKVFFDGAKIIDDTVPGFQFHGGYIYFSGSTGWATNYHRVDDLWLKQTCDVP